MTIKIQSSSFRNLEPSKLQIVSIFPHYRHWWNELDGKYRTFIYFPDTCTSDVVYQWDFKSVDSNESTSYHLRLQEYDKWVGKFKFTKISPPNKEFFSMYKKVFDIEVTLDTKVVVDVWNKDLKKNAPYEIQPWEIIRLTWFPASRLQAVAQSMMLAKKLEKVEVNVKDRKTWELKKEMRLPFNWEDWIINEMIGKAFEFSVDWSGLDTKYSFREVTPFMSELVGSKEPIDIEDMPF